MKSEHRDLILKAFRLADNKVGYPEIAKRLKLESAEKAAELVKLGHFVTLAEENRVTVREREVMKTLIRLEARRAELGSTPITLARLDRAAGKHSGWASKSMVSLAGIGLLVMLEPNRVRLTKSGWAFAWATKLIKPNWRVAR